MQEDGSNENLKIRFRRTSIKRRKLCPKCLSDLEIASPFGGWLIPQEYKCKACGYHGPIALETND
ncbi:MAG: hypothetical protein QXD82_01675 [Nitrososphaerales archaeon]